jgi:hypothetical protein
MKLFHTTIFALLFWAVLAPMCSSKFGKMPGDPAAEKPARPAPTPVAFATPTQMAGGIDYSQEPGLPVEWEEYTIQK